MYTSFFGLNEKPFSITPDPRYLYMSARHTEALAHLIYGVTESGGFIQLTGEVGTGKTTLIRGLLQQLPKNADIALVLNPQLSQVEFLGVILEELGIGPVANPESIKDLHTALNNFLLENHSKGRRTILIVDEAQNLSIDVLEQIRMLTNLETSRQKLLQITLIGQPELRQVLARNDLRQLAQRITGRYHLEPLSKEDTCEYIQHRILVAGGNGAIFTPAACKEAFRLSQGVPRIINVICDRALLGAYTQEQLTITPAFIRQAAREVYDLSAARVSAWQSWQKPLLAVVLTATIIIGAWVGSQYLPERERPVAAVKTPATVAPAETETIALEPAETFSAAEEIITEPFVTEESPIEAETVATNVISTSSVLSLDEFLRRHAENTNTSGAFKTLFNVWGVSYEPGKVNACDIAEDYGLQCLWQQGSLAQLQALNRPAILKLRDNSGTVHNVTLLNLSSTIATIEINKEQLDIPLTELLRIWFGSSLLIWQPPISNANALLPGARNPDIIWLRNSINSIQNRDQAIVSDPELYDDLLAAQVEAYQREKRLKVDGKVGAETLIAINTDLGTANIPLLLVGD